MAETQRWQAIPTQLDLVEFEQFVLPHLSPGFRTESNHGPAVSVTLQPKKTADLNHAGRTHDRR
jgi:hypothetical protein